MSIPPKYGRVYTRINGGVSCEAITFPLSCVLAAHTHTHMHTYTEVECTRMHGGGQVQGEGSIHGGGGDGEGYDTPSVSPGEVVGRREGGRGG